jgi:hypothetical protein
MVKKRQKPAMALIRRGRTVAPSTVAPHEYQKWCQLARWQYFISALF